MSIVKFTHRAQLQEQEVGMWEREKGEDESITALYFCTNMQYIHFNLCHDAMAFF